MRDATPLPRSSTFKAIRRHYADARFGQVHFYRIDPASDTGKTPLVCFPPTASSGAYFQDFMVEMGKDRTVIAIDSPGYGLSDGPPKPTSIKEMALSGGDVLDTLGYGERNKVDVVGWHTGEFLAVEIAVERPDLVRRVILPELPYHPPEYQKRMYDELIKPIATDEEAREYAMQRWDYWVMRRPEGVTLDRGIEYFADYMQAGRNHWWAYHGVWTGESDKRVGLIEQPVLVFNFHPEKGAPEGVEFVKDATVVDTPDLADRIFHKNIDRVARIFRHYLD